MGAVDEHVDALTYESLTGITTTEYEERLRTSIRDALASGDEVVSVTVVGSGTAASIVVRFRMTERPGRTFAMRRSIWPVPRPDSPYEDGSPEEFGGLIAMNFDEDIQTLW